jgi:GNAT superfamily N-acetyltransferase
MDLKQRHQIDWTWPIAPSLALTALLEELEGDAMLAGPGRDLDEVVIDRVFAKPFHEALQDFCVDAGIPGEPSRLQPIGTPLEARLVEVAQGPAIAESVRDEVKIVEAFSHEDVSLGVVALQRRLGGEGWWLAGLFTGATLSVEPTIQGFGIGRALVMARLILDESLPTWDHDEPAYSPGGAATIAAARRRLLEMSPDRSRDPGADGPLP